PWVVIGAAFAGLVQELPNRRAPAIMLALGLAILIITMSPLALLPSIGIAVAAAAVAAGLMLLAQRHVDSVMAFLSRNRPVVIAFVVEAQYKKYGYKLLSPSLKLPTAPVANGADEAADNRTLMQRISGFSEAALHDFTPVAVLLTIGSLVTALIRQVITPQL